MVSRGLCALLGCLVLAASGCTTLDADWRENRTTCVTVGALLGAAIGALASTPNHGDDNDLDAAVGAAVGGGGGPTNRSLRVAANGGDAGGRTRHARRDGARQRRCRARAD